MKTIKKASSRFNLCQALIDLQYDMWPDHVPNPAWIMDGGSECIECGGHVPDEKDGE